MNKMIMNNYINKRGIREYILCSLVHQTLTPLGEPVQALSPSFSAVQLQGQQSYHWKHEKSHGQSHIQSDVGVRHLPSG